MQAAHARLDALLRRAGRGRRRVLLLPAPSRRRRRPRTRVACGCRKPAPGMVEQAAARSGSRRRRARSSSATSGSTSSSRATPARAASWCAPATAAATKPCRRQDVNPLAIVDTLLDAARWILAARRGEPLTTRCRRRSPAPAVDAARLLALVRPFRGAPRRRRRRSARRRVHLRPRRARLARGAGADPRYDTTDRRARRRRQRRQQRRRARRRACGSPALVGPRRAGHAACSTRCTRASSRTQVIAPGGYDTPLKTRILAGGVHSAKQQVVRIDRDHQRRRRTARCAARSRRGRSPSPRGADAVLVSDYGSGLVTPALVDAPARARSGGAASARVPILVDSRYAVLLPRPDRLHAERVGSRADPRRPHRRRPARARARRAASCCGAPACRRCSSRAAAAAWRSSSRTQPTRHIPIFGSDEIADVTGAGDTVIATMTLALAAGASFYEAARLANYAGGLVVMKRGTATVSADELRAAIQLDARARPELGSGLIRLTVCSLGHRLLHGSRHLCEPRASSPSRRKSSPSSDVQRLPPRSPQLRHP